MFRSYLIGACALLACMSALAQTQPPSQQLPSVTITKPLPVVDYWKLPTVAGPQLSPNGKSIAVSAPVNGRMNLAVVDLETRKGTALTNFKDFDVLNIRWVGNDRLVFTLGNRNSPTGPGQFDGGGLFVVSRDGKESRKLAPTVREVRGSGQYVLRTMDVLRTIPGNTNEIIVAANQRTSNSADVYRLDLRTGRMTLLTPNRPEYADDWILDENLVPRVVKGWIKDTGIYPIYYRKSADAPWEEIARHTIDKAPAFVPQAILPDGKTLLVATNAGRDTMAVFKFDAETKKLGELIAQHPKFDMGADAQGDTVSGPVLEPETNKVVGFEVDGERLLVGWEDEKSARTQATIDQALPGMVNTFRRIPNSTRVLITSFSDVSPARWYLLDEEKKTLEELFSSRPWLTKDHLVEQKPFLLKTRDGLEILSYYFLPKNHKPGDKLPTVVHIHGGPFARADYWGYGFGYREAQVLASRGYAVVVPNFRITTGLGSKIYYSGFGTIGRQMSEDHEDAAKWAIAQGFADSKRVCISGASYGGYAALVALAKTPELFKCAVAGLVVSDLKMQLTSPSGDTAGSEANVAYWRSVIGQSTPGWDVADAVSPVNMASRIKGRVFMYAGSDDVRTPIEQTTAMRRALETAGNPPEVVLVKLEEGHGFGKEENNVDLYEKMLAFLDKHIGASSAK
jgi:dipeptidyl aminopeptidase/acylaminoacyl peptidase